MHLFRKKIDINKIIDNINSKDYTKRFCIMLFGLIISAISFNLFFEPYNIVIGGVSGLSLIVKEYLPIEPAVFIFIVSMILIVFSILFLGMKQTMRTLFVVLLYPVFIAATSFITNIIDLNTSSLILISLFGGVLDGFSSGLILKQGFSGGGTQIISQIMYKYLHISLGKASLIINALIIIFASFTFGITNSLYAICALYISSIITDRVILGVSDKKAFYIVTDKDDIIKEFIIKNLSHSITVIDVKGGYSNKKKKMLLCVIPTRQYFILKEVVKEIDNEAFFLITDSYEVLGGV